MTDPREVLGVAIGAADEEIRAAYLLKVKQYPPDRAPQEFEKIRDAYDTLRDPRRRTKTMLLSANPAEPIASLLAAEPPQRRFAGPQPWLEVLKTK